MAPRAKRSKALPNKAKKPSRGQLKKYHQFLSSLKTLSPKERTAVLPFINNEGAACLFDCAHNIRQHSGKRGSKLVKKASKSLSYLDNPKIHIDKQRAFLKKRGGGIITTLLSVGLPLLASALARK